MTTEISYVNERVVRAECPGVHSDFVCVREDVCRRHEGTWNSRVFAFVPEVKFSDGTPVASYDYLNDTDYTKTDHV